MKMKIVIAVYIEILQSTNVYGDNSLVTFRIVVTVSCAHSFKLSWFCIHNLFLFILPIYLIYLPDNDIHWRDSRLKINKGHLLWRLFKALECTISLCSFSFISLLDVGQHYFTYLFHAMSKMPQILHCYVSNIFPMQ